MKNKHTFKRSILFLFCTITCLYGFQGQANNNTNGTSTIKLTDALDVLSEKHHVFFSYETQLLKNLMVETTLDELETNRRNIEEVVNELLKETDLRFKTVGEKYIVIYRNNRNGKNKLKQLKKKISELQDIEDGSDIFMYPGSKKRQKRLSNKKLSETNLYPTALIFSTERNIVI